MQMGDLICILLGSKVPVVLREHEAGIGYDFVGAAYVHGIMHGEALAILRLESMSTMRSTGTYQSENFVSSKNASFSFELFYI